MKAEKSPCVSEVAGRGWLEWKAFSKLLNSLCPFQSCTSSANSVFVFSLPFFSALERNTALKADGRYLVNKGLSLWLLLSLILTDYMNILNMRNSLQVHCNIGSVPVPSDIIFCFNF